jgi:hypothetical protein
MDEYLFTWFRNVTSLIDKTTISRIDQTSELLIGVPSKLRDDGCHIEKSSQIENCNFQGMKARKVHPRRGRDTLTKIKIEGFPKDIIVEHTKGIRWLNPHRRELKWHMQRIYQAAIAAAQKPNNEHQENSIPVITPLEDRGITDPRIHVDDINPWADLRTDALDGGDIFDIWRSYAAISEPDNMNIDSDPFPF